MGYWLPKLEDEMKAVLHNDETAVAPHYNMMQYHMGWLDEDFQPVQVPAGKRLRPMLCLLACAEVGGDPSQALPAAAAIELLHNFSLIHDDIEDGDEMRRHRATVWKIWGVPQAINAGDGMFTLAYAALQRLTRLGVDSGVTLAALDTFTSTCLALTEGQHLDMDFEQREQVTADEYLRMIQGKTAALISAAVAIGARIGGASTDQTAALQKFGQSIGLAFQIQDDILGIWGDPAVTGKAAGNDILRHKKSLPLLHALEHAQAGQALQDLMQGEFDAEQLPQAMNLLEKAGTRAFVEDQLVHHHNGAVGALDEALDLQLENSLLFALTNTLLHRRA